MTGSIDQFTYCLMHQKVEDRMSPIGLVCDCCKEHIDTCAHEQKCISYWESQPGAYSLDREPCFIYTLVWEHFRIRSLHPPESREDSRSFNKKPGHHLKPEKDSISWLDDFFNEQKKPDQEL